MIPQHRSLGVVQIYMSFNEIVDLTAGVYF